MINVNELKYNEKGLIPAIVTDARTGKVLMLAYMNSESLEITLKEEKTCFYSRRVPPIFAIRIAKILFLPSFQ